MIERLHRSLTRLALCCQARSNASPYSSRESVPSTLRQTRSTVSTFTRLVPPARQAACTERTSPLSAFDWAWTSPQRQDISDERMSSWERWRQDSGVNVRRA